jgi:hypothetical protein
VAAGVNHDYVGADGALGGDFRGKDSCRPFAVLWELGAQVYEVLRSDDDWVQPDLPRALGKEVRVRARLGLRSSLWR